MKKQISGLYETKQSAREISMLTLRKLLVAKPQNVTGRISLIKRAQGYEKELESGDDFFNITK